MKNQHLVALLIYLFFATPVHANDNELHEFFDRLTEENIFKSLKLIANLDKEFEKIVKKNPQSLIARNERGQFPIMRASELGLAKFVVEMFKFNNVQKIYQATDDRGLTIADHATTAVRITYKICSSKQRAFGLLSPSTNENLETIKNTYRFLTEALVKAKVPTNPRRVAQVWLDECRNADQKIRRKIKELGAKNSSKLIQEYLLEQDNLRREKLKLEQNSKNLLFSQPPISDNLKNAFENTDGIYIGPLKLVTNPEGDGVLIGGVNGNIESYNDSYRGANKIKRIATIYPAVGQIVKRIEVFEISNIDDVTHAIARSKDAGLRGVGIGVTLPHIEFRNRRFFFDNVTIEKNAPPLTKKATKENGSKRVGLVYAHLAKKKRDQKISLPVLNDKQKAYLRTAKSVKVGPLHLALRIDGKGLVIAKIDGDVSKIIGYVSGRKGRPNLAVGQRVHAIENRPANTLDDVRDILQLTRQRGFREIEMNISTIIGTQFGAPYVFRRIPFE